MIAYFFPPVGGLGAAGTQRMCHLARYLPLHDWQVSVLTARQSSYEPYLVMDPSLAAKVPADTNVSRTPVIRGLTPLLRLKGRIAGAIHGRPGSVPIEQRGTTEQSPNRSGVSRNWYRTLKDSVTDLFEIPDEEIGWLLPAVIAGLGIVRRQRIDVLFSSGRPWTSHLIGYVLKRLTGRPLITDFRDPWMTNPFRLRYAAFRNRAEGWLERLVVHSADLIVANTRHLREEFASRFPGAGPKCIEIGNGFDPEDYRDLTAHSSSERRGDRLRLVHSGFLYGARDPATLLDAISLLNALHGLDSRHLDVELVGSVELPYDLAKCVKARGLDATISLIGQVSYEESLARIASCDVAILLQPGTKTQVPSKLYEYVALGKPVLAIAEKGSAVADIVAHARLGDVADAKSAVEVASSIHALYQRRNAGKPLVLSAESRDEFDVRRRVGVFAEHIKPLVGRAR